MPGWLSTFQVPHVSPMATATQVLARPRRCSHDTPPSPEPRPRLLKGRLIVAAAANQICPRGMSLSGLHPSEALHFRALRRPREAMSEALVVKQEPAIHTLARLQELFHPIVADLHTCLEPTIENRNSCGHVEEDDE